MTALAGAMINGDESWADSCNRTAPLQVRLGVPLVPARAAIATRQFGVYYRLEFWERGRCACLHKVV